MKPAKTTLHVTRFVDCPFSAVIEFAERALRERPSIVFSPAPAIREPGDLRTELTDDLTDRTRKHDALMLAWKPSLTRLFPDFHGVLTVRPQGRGAWLRIRGSYEPPFGFAGRVFDALAGRVIARLTLARLLRGIARDAEHRWHTLHKERSA